jgi:type II secretory pathway component PulK
MNGRRIAANDGVALIFALFAVIILTALVVTFATLARTDVLLAGNRSTTLQAFYAAQSSLNYCRTVLAADDPAQDSTGEEWAQVQDSPPELDIPGFSVSATIEDESGRLNINTATKDMLMSLPGMTEEAADSILDWRDGDDDPRPLGAESDYYLSLESPYEAANGAFQTMDELRLVKGVDEALFEGDGTDALPGLRNLVTVRSGERNVDATGQARLNINTADPAQLERRLGDILSADDFTALERRRRQGPLQSLSDLMSIDGVAPDKMAQALDRLRVNDDNFIEGTVNLNTAREPVLEAIGLPADVAQTLIDRRTEQPLATKGDLAGVPGVTGEMMAAVADRIATKSSVFQVRAFAQADERPIHAGVSALLDRSGQSPRTILWQEDFGAPPESNEVQEQVSGP